jgi:hypothetical protein
VKNQTRLASEFSASTGIERHCQMMADQQISDVKPPACMITFREQPVHNGTLFRAGVLLEVFNDREWMPSLSPVRQPACRMIRPQSRKTYPVPEAPGDHPEDCDRITWRQAEWHQI